MKDESSRQIIKAEEIKEMFPCYKYAVVFLEAEDIIQSSELIFLGDFYDRGAWCVK